VLGDDTDSGVGAEWLSHIAKLSTHRDQGALHETLGGIDPEEMIEIFDTFCEEAAAPAPAPGEEEEENSDDSSA